MNLLTWIKNGVSSFKNSRLKSGVFFDSETNITDLVFTSDPWRFFLTFGWNNMIANFADNESTYFAEPKHRDLRRALVGRPGLRPFGYVTNIERQYIVDNDATRTVRQDSTRERDSAQVMLTPLIWIAAHVIAFSPTVRRRFTLQAFNHSQIPLVISELLQRTRNCENGFYRWTTGIYLTGFQRLIAFAPEIVGSYADPDLLDTDGGIQSFLSFVDYLSNRPGNYIKMVPVNQRTVPPLESGHMVTANAFTVGYTHDYLTSLVHITAHSSSEPNFVFSADAIIGTYHYRLGNNEYQGHHNTSFRFRGRATSIQWVDHVIFRVTGEQPNRNDTGLPMNEDVDYSSKKKTFKPKEKENNVTTQEQSASPAGKMSEFSKLKEELISLMRTEFKHLNKRRKVFFQNNARNKNRYSNDLAYAS